MYLEMFQTSLRDDVYKHPPTFDFLFSHAYKLNRDDYAGLLVLSLLEVLYLHIILIHRVSLARVHFSYFLTSVLSYKKLLVTGFRTKKLKTNARLIELVGALFYNLCKHPLFSILFLYLLYLYHPPSSCGAKSYHHITNGL